MSSPGGEDEYHASDQSISNDNTHTSSSNITSDLEAPAPVFLINKIENDKPRLIQKAGRGGIAAARSAGGRSDELAAQDVDVVPVSDHADARPLHKGLSGTAEHV